MCTINCVVRSLFRLATRRTCGRTVPTNPVPLTMLYLSLAPSSFGQLRRRRRAAPSDQSASEKKDDEGPLSETVTGAGDGRGGGGGGATDSRNEPPPNGGRYKAAAKRSAVPVSSSETPLRIASVRALTASPSADGSSPAAAGYDDRATAPGDGGRGSAESFSVDPRRVGWGVFGTRRRITR